MTTSDKEFDLIVWGATGFVGELICEYLVAHYAGSDIRWAMGGRSASKLEAVRAKLGAAAADVPLVTGDAMDKAALDQIVLRTRVVISTVGPYALYGTEMLAACARHGVDYVDLTGETQWIAKMIDAYQEDAEKSGARIVNCCGYDSIPSDLGVFFLNEHAKSQGNAPCTEITMAVKAAKGGASGGTIWSLMNVIVEAQKDKEVAKVLRNPFALAPKGQRTGPRQPSNNILRHDADFGVWLAPFVMAAINTRVVHRSNALMDYPMTKDFRYGEAMMTGAGFGGRMAAYGMAAGLGLFGLLAALAPTRWLLKSYVLPKPGEGPSKEARETGFFKHVVLGKSESGSTYKVGVAGDRDPGYGSTAKMITEAALCLLKDVPKSETKGGLWTPASAMGQKLIDRLVQHAGLTFTIQD